MESSRRFSRADWIVIAVVLTILCGIGIEAIRSLRETSARLETANRLKDCALAVHKFHFDYKRFPDAYASLTQDGEPRSLWVHLLPYVGQKDLAENLRFDAVVPAYQASSDSFHTDPRGRLNFAGNIRVFGWKSCPPLATEYPAKAIWDKPPSPDQTIRSGMTLERFPRGTTNTFLMTTRFANCNNDYDSTPTATNPHGGTTYGGHPGSRSGGFFGAGSHANAATSGSPTDNDLIFQLTPRPAECNGAPSLYGHAFRADGMSMAMADGSVRNIRPNISVKYFQKCLVQYWEWGSVWEDEDE